MNSREEQLEELKSTVQLLGSYKTAPEPKPPRKKLLSQLCEQIAAYYGYSKYLANLLVELFPIGEIIEFFDASESARPLTIRTNSLKSRRRDLAQRLISRGVNLDPIGEWSKVGLVVFESPIPIGASPEYLCGHYMIQSASSFLPVMALDPRPEEKILDMCAAPGGKSTYIAALMKNTGMLVANDTNKSRTKSLMANIQRLGITNTIITNLDARRFPVVMGSFDRVLLDAPCSGTGVVHKDPSVKTDETKVDVKFCEHVQKELILHAIDSLKNGGILVYSTCSITVSENEKVIDYALRKRNVKIIETGIDVGNDGFTKFRENRFNSKMKLTKRVYPHLHNMDGFFYAKLLKIDGAVRDSK